MLIDLTPHGPACFPHIQTHTPSHFRLRNYKDAFHSTPKHFPPIFLNVENFSSQSDGYFFIFIQKFSEMETAREMLKPFRSDNGHFEFYFQFDDVNKGRMFLTYLKSKTKPESFDFEIDTNRTLSIKGILISDPGGHTSITSKEIEECIEFLKTGIMDKAAIYHN